MKKDKWVWMPHSAHLIVGRDCRFHLATHVGKYLVSTVGEYLPDSQVREIFANSRGIELKGMGDERLADYLKKIGYEDIGSGRKFETMVFKSKKRKGPPSCCPFTATDWMNVDMDGYNDSAQAFKGHMKLCLKWSRETKALEELTPRERRERAILKTIEVLRKTNDFAK